MTYNKLDNLSKQYQDTFFLALFIFIFIPLIQSCESSKTIVYSSDEDTQLRTLLGVPKHFPLPRIPDYNIPTAAKIDLGRHLFYDKRLSANGTQSCASCHIQMLAFSDGETTSQGSTGDILARNSQGLGNAVYHATLTWANDAFLDLEQQLPVPIRADDPIELGVTSEYVDEVLSRFDEDPLYADKLIAAFPDSQTAATMEKLIHALASFCRTLISGSSAYDRYLQGDSEALTEQQTLGLQLFHGERFECFHCHSGINFSTSYIDNNSNPDTQTYPFFNTGLYNISSTGDYPEVDQGLYDLTQKTYERGFFRPQSLRNVALTAPYMHDGSIETLRQVVEHYARGGRIIESGPYAGDGRDSLLKSGLVRGFSTNDEEIDALIAFLESLTDYDFINNPMLSNPFEEPLQ